MFKRLTDRLVYGLLAVAAMITFALSFLVVADIIGRVVFNSPVKGTPEIVSMSIVIICFLLAGYSVQSGSMIKADILIAKLGGRSNLVATAVTAILGAGFFFLIGWGSFEPLAHAWSSGEYEGEGALRVPAWPARLVIMLGGFLVAAIYLGQLTAAVRALIRDEDHDA